MWDDSYFAAVRRMAELAGPGNPDAAHLTLMGIEPTYPSAKFGYIIPAGKDPVSRVVSFKEKPDEQTAAGYIARGALWNGGVFAFQLATCSKPPTSSWTSAILPTCRQLRAAEADQLRLRCGRKGTRHRGDALCRRVEGRGDLEHLLRGDVRPDHRQGADGRDLPQLQRHQPAEHPIICMGLQDMVVAASSDGILVSDKGRSSHIKPYVEQVEGRSPVCGKELGVLHGAGCAARGHHHPDRG